ncbi:MAG: methyl-accepting chemotaxis protein [Cyanobacteria bacterium P01_F01_bin.150]
MTSPFRSDRSAPYDSTPGNNRQMLRRWWQNLSIRSKTTILAVALGSAPVLFVGTLSYIFSNRAIIREIATVEQTRAVDSQNLINVFMRDRLIDIKTLAEMDIFTVEELRDASTQEERTEVLERFKIQAGDIYNSIGVFDPEGNVIAETFGAKPLGNHLDRTYITAARETEGAVLSEPSISSSSGIFSVYAASVIKDRNTDELVGYVRTRIPVSVLRAFLESTKTEDVKSLYLIDRDGQIFLGPEGAYIRRVGSDGQPLDIDSEEGVLTSFSTDQLFEDLNLEQAAVGQGVEIHRNQQLPQQPKQLVAFSGTSSLEGLPDLGWGTLVTTDVAAALAPQRSLLFTLILGSVVAALGSAILAVIFARRATRSILAANRAVSDIGAGNLATRLAVEGTDEISQLSQNINRMASQLDESERGKMLQASQASLLASITSISPELPFAERIEALSGVLDRMRRLLTLDRCLLVAIQANGTQAVLGESTAPSYPKVLEQDGGIDELFSPANIASLREEQLINHSDVAQAAASSEQAAYLKSLRVKSGLMVPIVGQNQFFGALVAHHCQVEHSWTEREIDLAQQIARQLGILFVVEEFSTLAEEQRQLKEGLQQRALDLMIQVDPVSQGDLTVRARVTEDEIGTLADSYNATIESLQKLVTQVQTVANQVISTASGNDVAVQTLSTGAIAQTEKIGAALERIQAMTASTKAVSSDAEQAAQVAQQTALIVESGDQAMNRTVDGITAIRETVAETAKKVKNLGESSQKISKVVNLIETFAAQTNLLALNASIEAARAGEEGRGFAVVADEVRSLAYQSSEAASEIEKLVNDIQTETNEVVVAMEVGTEQVVSGTQLVQETKKSLTEITMASAQIRDLVVGIVDATNIQNSNADEVTQTIESVASISDKTTQEIGQVSQSFNELLDVAQSLKQSLEQFKVN